MAQRQTLADNDRLFHLMADNILDGLAIIEQDRVIYVNDRLCEITGYTRDELMAFDSFDMLAPEWKHSFERDYGAHDPHKMFEENEYIIVRKDGQRRIVSNRHSHLLSDDGDRILYHFEIITDVTDRARAEQQLKTLNQELEQRVEERTAALRSTNELLSREIQERRQAENELEAQKRSLEDLNAALRVLLHKGEEDKQELEENLRFNVRELVMPRLEQLLASRLDPHQRESLRVIKSNLDDILSPFGRSLSVRSRHLTPREIHIASLIKEGRTTKEIAALLHLSVRTVTTHRDNIRKKLGLTARKANLRTHLMSIM